MIFNWFDLINKYNMQIKGVLHIGAYTGEELELYRATGLSNTVLFEPQKELFEIVKEKCLVDETVYNVALGNINDQHRNMYISYTEGGIQNGSGASSSLLKPKKHLIEHPNVKFVRKEEVEIYRLDNFCSAFNVDIKEYNFINVDVQGYELEVFKGAEKSLQHIDYIIAEVNRDEVYTQCPLIEDIDSYLKDFGFTRELVTWQSESWGDAFYIKGTQ